MRLTSKDFNQIKKGVLLRCIDPGANITKGKLYIALDDADTDDESCVIVFNDKGNEQGYFITRFELVSKTGKLITRTGTL